MASKWDWKSGEGVSQVDDPAEVDAAFERGEWPLGSAVIGLAFNCSLAEASPRIVRAMQLPDRDQRGFAFTAAGAAARLNGELTPELYAALRAEGPGGVAEHPIRDTLTFVPFRKLPPWFKRRWVFVTVRNKLEGWWLRSEDAVADAWRVLRGRRS
ncbi:hypothetical protein [Streptomyces sporangiiformans]|uniref:Uncharacterized protein n=1 Tax=Streptomyces sporangiiformans TaxID=2315329 RepID=A0A505D5B1_9ACTN|nr:hypothetical protein [Streptomyces sporangiiformans]TPQ19733.1 hypothetical protein FGD71_024075 [Streptomyces sporangiiformans]